VAAGIVKEQMKQILGDEILKVAHVEVTWAEGGRQDGVDLAYLMTAQYKLDQAIELMEPIGGTGEKAPEVKKPESGKPPEGEKPPEEKPPET
jgi:hypothetical protein